MKVNIDGVDYQFHRNQNNELIVESEGYDIGKVISLPELSREEVSSVFEVFIDMVSCLNENVVSYTDLMTLYERYSNYNTDQVDDTLIVLYGTEIVAVLLGVNDLDFVEMDMRAKLVFHYFTINEFKPYYIYYSELLDYANDIF